MTTSPALETLADAYGVMTSYLDYLDRPVTVSDEAVQLALAALGVPADSEAAARQALAAWEASRRDEPTPPSLVVRSDRSAVVPTAGPCEALLHTEDGRQLPVPTSAAEVVLAAGLPTGYHRLTLRGSSHGAEIPVVVAPARCPTPTGRSWGWMVQLYQARSADSWGMGDFGDLSSLARWSGELGAGMLLVNPLHAAAPVLPLQNSPYYPSSRRFRSPLYLRPGDLPEVAALSAADRRRISDLAAGVRGEVDALIDRDAVFRAKDEALRLLFAVPRTAQREGAFAAFRQAQGAGLHDFATFCALARRHGLPWQTWPAPLRDPAGAAVAQARRELADEIDYHTWLQWLCDTQLESARDAAGAAGMVIGVIHDLAVGVDPGGADAWALQADLALGVTVGAPPDGFNQKGQNWHLPPLLPQRLVATAYAPFRDMVRSVLRHAGGIRIDHVMGLWRLWWVPEARSAAEGTYVRYPADDLLGILALEAQRAAAVVVGEDLGTVPKGVRETMADRGVLSSRVLWFERVDDDPEGERLPAAGYPQLALSSVTTHDLPTAAGWLADADWQVQTALGLYGPNTTPEAEAARKVTERSEIGRLLVAEGLLDRAPSAVVSDPAEAEPLVLAMHRFLARTPSVLVATGLGDALGDRRQPNMPGTTDAYPNWCLPLARTGADGSPRAVWLEEILTDPLVAAVARILAERRTR